MNADLYSIWISIKTAGLATVITFFIGILAARWLTFYKGRFRLILDTLFNLPLVLPPTVVGFFLLLLLGKNGPIGKLLFAAGINLIFSWPAAVIAATIVAFPLMYRTCKGTFEQVNISLISAARTLGASERKIFLRVILPLSWPGIIAGTLLAFARALGEFGATLMIAGDIPYKTQTMPIAIYFEVEGGSMNNAMLLVFIMMLLSYLVVLLMNYWNNYQTRYTNQTTVSQ